MNHAVHTHHKRKENSPRYHTGVNTARKSASVTVICAAVSKMVAAVLFSAAATATDPLFMPC